MIENELLFLGLLKDGPKHGYEIRSIVKSKITPFFAIESTSIYYPLKQLEKEKLVKFSSAQAGKRPEKYVYQLTAKGEARFDRLLKDSLVTIERPFFNLDLALYFISYLKPKEIRRRLNARLNLLQRLEKQLSELTSNTRPKPYLINILRHNQRLLRAEIDSLSDFLASLT
jgi:DNA-binding PadR family transcriptional regulator